MAQWPPFRGLHDAAQVRTPTPRMLRGVAFSSMTASSATPYNPPIPNPALHPAARTCFFPPSR
ncbi:hypothetical protein BER2_1171 [plant metagenome]|uniref:Uncharacterized protein n=1 Tax=plant metagenome TaxID=1297885 RepID=A0A484R728_9ZZZZ